MADSTHTTGRPFVDPADTTAEADSSALATSALERSFESLRLDVGSTLMMERIDARRKFPVQLLGYRKSRSLMVTAPRHRGGELHIESGESLRLRFLTGKTAGALETHVLYRCYQPFSYLHLAYPLRVECVDIRDAERVAADLIAEVDSDFVLVGDWPKRIDVIDVSESGLRFHSNDFLGLVGHELNFSLELRVSGVRKSLRLPGVIRNIEHLEHADAKRDYQVGVQFTEVDQEQQFVLSSFVLAQGRSPHV